MQRDPDIVKKVMDDYIHGRGTIEQIAIFYHLSKEEVLEMTGNGEMLEVEIEGDKVDDNEVGKDVNIQRSYKVKAEYSQAG